jgi:hypothetical protein
MIRRSCSLSDLRRTCCHDRVFWLCRLDDGLGGVRFASLYIRSLDHRNNSARNIQPLYLSNHDPQGCRAARTIRAEILAVDDLPPTLRCRYAPCSFPQFWVSNYCPRPISAQYSPCLHCGNNVSVALPPSLGYEKLTTYGRQIIKVNTFTQTPASLQPHIIILQEKKELYRSLLLQIIVYIYLNKDLVEDELFTPVQEDPL